MKRSGKAEARQELCVNSKRLDCDPFSRLCLIQELACPDAHLSWAQSFPDEARFSGWGPRSTWALRRGWDRVKLSSPLRTFPPTHHTTLHTVHTVHCTGQTGSDGESRSRAGQHLPLSSVRLRHIRPCLLSLREQSIFPECSTLSEKREEGGWRAVNGE